MNKIIEPLKNETVTDTFRQQIKLLLYSFMQTSPKCWTCKRQKVLKAPAPCRLYANWNINRSSERWTCNQRCVCSFTRLNTLFYYVVKLTRNLTISGRRIESEPAVGMHVKCWISNSVDINLFAIIAAQADHKGVSRRLEKVEDLNLHRHLDSYKRTNT